MHRAYDAAAHRLLGGVRERIARAAPLMAVAEAPVDA